MPNLLVVGESGSGKSTILRRFELENSVEMDEECNPIVPVLKFDMPPEPSESRFWSTILNELMIAHKSTERVSEKQRRAEQNLLFCKVKMLVIDEIHNLLHGSIRQQRQFLSVLKNLSNKLQIPLVLSGTRESILIMHTDAQLSSRFTVTGIDKWKLDREYLRLLASFERLLPLQKESKLASEILATKIFRMSDGNLGAISRIIESAALHAIRTGEERITVNILDSINWVRVEDYAKQASTL
jgi:type II secretory pathway predicted ATPase ExeA